MSHVKRILLGLVALSAVTIAGCTLAFDEPWLACIPLVPLWVGAMWSLIEKRKGSREE